MLGATSCGWLNEDMDATSPSPASKDQPLEEAPSQKEENLLLSTQESEPAVKAMIPVAKENKNNKATKIDSHYGILIEELGMQIKKLRAELDFLNEEIYVLKAQSQVWENPFSIYNKEIVLDNGTTIYGKIIYQDQ